MNARVLDDRRISLALNAVHTTQEKVMLLLSIKAGLRAAEISALTWDRIDLDGNVLLLKKTKGDKPRRVPINAQLREALLQLKEKAPEEGGVVIQPHKKPLSPNSVAQWFRKFYTQRLGWEGFSSHSGRRTFVTRAARAIIGTGGTIKDVQEMAGHSDIRTTSIYIDTNEDAQARVVDII